jgi:type IV secretory pathway VirB10-like protein
MKSYLACIALLVPLALSGCTHKHTAQNQPPLAPPIEDTPPPKPDNAPKNLPPPVITVPEPTQPTTSNTTPPPPPPKPAPKHHKKPAQPTDQNTQVASNNPPPEVSATGQFSTGEPADLRKQTSNSIAETERGLNGITRKLNDQEQKTSAQIREFLKQAKTALTTGDVDGAHTLALKAKVLLAELTQ